VVFAVEEGQLQLLLIRRAFAPFAGQWALPGGFVDMEEDLHAAALRELEEETGFVPSRMEQLGAYGAPDRDPRGRVITIAYWALVRSPSKPVRGGSDAEKAEWFPARSLPPLAFDHAKIIADALARLELTLRRAPVGMDLLPEAFTLSQIQSVYEAVLGKPLDKRNFRKKILAFHFLKPLPGQQVTGRQRPAQLYSFDASLFEQLRRSGLHFEL
jgi:8-oxo-dGTP diphosphatase